MWQYPESTDLTDTAFWDAYRDSISIPSVVDLKRGHIPRSMDRLFRRHLPYDSRFRFLEIGCRREDGWSIFHSVLGTE
jgi:hypothetical protein